MSQTTWKRSGIDGTMTHQVWMLHPAAGSLCRMTEVHRCYWQLIICYTLQKRDSVIDSLRSWRYCVGARLKFSHSNILPTAPPPNLTRLLHNTASYAGYVIDWDCLHGDGGPKIGEVTCGRSSHLSCKRDQIEVRDYSHGQAAEKKKLIIVFTFSIKREIISLFTWNFERLCTIRRNTALQCWNNVATIRNNIATMLQRRVTAGAKNLCCKSSHSLLLFTNPESATGRSKAVGAGRRKERRGENRETVSFSAGVPVTSIIEMAISYNYEYLAMFTDTGLLWIGSADLQKIYCEFNTSCPSRPKQLTWCAMGAVICYWDDFWIGIITPDFLTYFTYQMDSAVHLVQELDGVRIIGNETHELLQRVPAAVEQVFKIGSMEPGAMLFDASKEFEKKSARAEEYIRMIKERLPEAVQQCIHAAAGEHEPAIQRGLLRAASFGKSFLTDMSPHAFVSMCRNLRVLNAVRDYIVGIPLTYGQLEKLTMKTLIDRLVLRRHYCLAIRICDYWKIPKGEGASRILGHWACYKVQQANVDDEEIARAINSKLGETPGISYSEIASKAVDCGRTHLAIKLLDYEAEAADQVPLLMRMNKDDLALEKAIMSGDTDLVYMVVIHLKDNLIPGEFLMAIRYRPVALSLHIKYCKDQDRSTLVDLFYQDDQFMNSGNAFVQDSYSEKTVTQRVSCVTPSGLSCNLVLRAFLSLAIKSKIITLSKAQMSYQQGGFQFYSKMFKLEEKYRRTFMDLSFTDTIYQQRLLCTFRCILQGDLKAAEQLKKEFKIPDKRFVTFFYQRLDRGAGGKGARGGRKERVSVLSSSRIHRVLVFTRPALLAESHNWLELDKFSKARKSLIGYEVSLLTITSPFFEVCLECNNRIEAEKYVSRVLLEKKVTCYVKLGKYEDAAKTAFAQKSEEGQDLVLGKCATSNRPLVNRI
ncbi:unnamed protein product [Porites lobata]|uniref:Vacuolar protein sorting-associated protein 16 homolog n=2 Tax=Porites TaxID=46719 RepID=A0ABN8P561_9CNID|nr:unnamed protein product [Porites lobata]